MDEYMMRNVSCGLPKGGGVGWVTQGRWGGVEACIGVYAQRRLNRCVIWEGDHSDDSLVVSSMRSPAYSSFPSPFIHSGYFYSASSSQLLLGVAPDTGRILCRNFTPKRHRLLRMKDLSKVSIRGG